MTQKKAYTQISINCVGKLCAGPETDNNDNKGFLV